MELTNITVGVHFSGAEFEPRYRLYVDNYLLTERTWIWPTYKNYVEEHITVKIPEGKHKLYIVPVPENAAFELKNCVVNDKPVELEQSTFIV